MPTYRFIIRNYIREDGIANNFVDLDLTNSEFRTISADFGNPSKISGFVSSKLRKGVTVLGFPVEVARESQEDSQQNNLVLPSKSSRIRRLCAIPFEFMLKFII